MEERASRGIARRLRRMIVTGELEPGALLAETDLLALLGCGRTPLREALQRLAFDYQVVIPPRRGILIPQLDIVEFQEGHEATMAMGGPCVRLAAQRINDEQLQSIKDVVDGQELANEEGRFYDLTELDSRFHNLIVEATGNRYMKNSFSRMYGSISRFVYKAYASAGNAKTSIADHAAIIEALQDRDPDLAERAFHDHIHKASQRILRVLGLGESATAG